MKRVGTLVAMVGAICLALPGVGQAASVKAQTNKPGSSCTIRSSIAVQPAGSNGQVTYGVRVPSCRTKYHVRRIRSAGTLIKNEGDAVDATPGRARGRPPYNNSRTYSYSMGSPSDRYRSQFQISILIKVRTTPLTRKPERWKDPGRKCEVTTTYHARDTLNCTLVDRG